MTKKRAWTPEEDAIVRDNFPFKASAEVAVMVDRTRGAVNQRARFLGATKDPDAVKRIWSEAAKRSANAGRFPSKHGFSGDNCGGTYTTWKSMNQRCNYPKHKSYEDYGGRGIRVCERWLDFMAFLEDMGERPSGMTLDRFPDANGNYEPGNCRWATVSEQCRNRRSNRWITFNGEAMTLAAWSERTGIRPDTLAFRLRAGWSIEDAMTTAVDPLNGLHRGSVVRVNGGMVSGKEVQP